MSDAARALLESSLDLAVPLWIGELQGVPFHVLQERARECSQVIAEKGDIILYRSEKKGETARAFNRLAEGIACLSFSPGGVKCFGRHWIGKQWNEVDVDDKAVTALREIIQVVDQVQQPEEQSLALQRVREIADAAFTEGAHVET